MTQTCESFRDRLSLLLYGELTFEQEEQIHQHVAGCSACQMELDRARRMHQALDEEEPVMPAALLVDARRSLRLRLAGERERAAVRAAGGRWMLSWSAFLKPAGVLAALVAAFAAGRSTDGLPGIVAGTRQTPVASRVSFVEPEQGGGVRISLDETRRRVVRGSMEDPSIRQLLMTAARDSSDPGLRVESVEMLCSRSGEAEVRNALLHALEHDSVPSVRLKALEGLKLFSKDQQTRQVLARVLLNDTHAAVRAQAIDLLTQSPSADVVAPLQELMRREQDDYVRLRTQSILRDMKASPGIF
jgi:plasmid stability protein